MAYATFTDALMQAKRASGLRGVPFTTGDYQNLQAGYMEGAAERNAAERSGALAEKSQGAQEKNWADTLAQEKTLSAQQLGQQRELSALSRQQTERITADQMSAQDAASKKALTGNVLSTGATLGGAYLMKPAATVAAPAANAALTGAAGDAALSASYAGETGAGAGYAGSLGTVASAAAIMARQKWGAPDTPDEEKTFTQSAFNDPFFGTTRYGASKVFGDSNEITKVAAGAEDFIETAVADPIAKFGAGDFGGGVEGIVAGPVRAVRDAARSVCIIVTACTDPDSPEVEIAREFRDKFLDAEQLRGYYLLASKIVPLIESNGIVKKLVKKWLVDRLVDYGAVMLGKKEKTSLRSSYIVSRLFLSLIRAVGKTRTQFVRSNMEVY
jgi:hypothetical protein